MRVGTRTKRANEARSQRAKVLHAEIVARNDTGLDDDVVLAILRAKDGQRTEWRSVDELLEHLDLV